MKDVIRNIILENQNTDLPQLTERQIQIPIKNKPLESLFDKP